MRGVRWSWLEWVWLTLVYLFVLGPAGMVIYGSFNSATSFPSSFEHLTFRWYLALAQRVEFLHALVVSLEVAVTAAGIATILGVPASLVMARREFPFKEAVVGFVMAPLVLPQIVMGLAMLQLLTVMRVPITMMGLILSHAVFVLPYVVRVMFSCLSGLSPAIEEAAASLGATPWRRFWLVTVPITRPGILSGFILAVILSFVNVPLSLFLTTPGATTLPIAMFAYMESRIDPFIAAVGSLVVLTVLSCSLLVERFLKIRLIV